MNIGKLWTASVAYASLLTGAGLSVAGNLADTFRIRGVLVDAVDIALAIGPPLATLFVAELFVSEWPRRWSLQTVRWVTTILVGSLAMVVSWLHLSELLAARGQTPMVAMLWPLAIDGLAIMAMAKLLAMRGHLATVAMAKAPLTMSDVAMAKHQMAIDNEMAKVEAAKNSPARYVATAEDVAISEAAFRGQPDLQAWTDGHEAAIDQAGQDFANEVEAFVSGPPVVPGKPLPRRVPEEARALYLAWVPDEVSPADADALVAAYFGKSTRTARDWRRLTLDGLV